MRILFGTVILCVVLTGAGCGPKKDEGEKEQGREPTPVPVKVETVASRDVRDSWRYSGEIQADRQFKLAFKQGGYVLSLHQVRGADGRPRDVQVGDEVPAGTVLARVRQRDYKASLDQATGQKRSSEASVGSSEADLEEAKSDQTKAELDFKRAQALYDAKAMTRPDYDDAVNQYQSALAKVQSSLKQIETRRGQLKTAEGELETAQIALDDTNLVTSARSVIVTKDVEPGSLVAQGTTGFTVAETRVVKIEFGVPDNMLSHFKMGAGVPVDVQGVPDGHLNGTITGIASSADTDTRVFNIQVSLPNAKRSLKVGMIASVQIVQSASVQEMPLVPTTALSTAQSGSDSFSVFVIHEENGKQVAQLRSVRAGEIIGRSIAIREGLTPGEKIIVNRPDQLTNGAEVRVIE